MIRRSFIYRNSCKAIWLIFALAVLFIVSSCGASEKIAMPDVINQSPSEALESLEQAGFDVSFVSVVDTNDHELFTTEIESNEFSVVAVKPSVGEKVSPTGIIKLVCDYSTLTSEQEVTEPPTTEATTTQATTIKPTTQKKKTNDDRYADSAEHLSDFKVIDGGGFSAIVDDDLKGDFTELRNCALYTMKKAYKKLETEDMGVFGYFEGGAEPAFTYDSEFGDNQIYIYEDWASPKGFQWVLSPDDWKYIKGN